MAAAHCLIADLSTRPTDPADVARLRAERLGQTDAVKRRARLMKQKTALIEQVRRAESLVTTGRRDLDWFDAVDAELQAKLATVDAELAELIAIPSEHDYAARLAEVRRIAPDPRELDLVDDNLRRVLAALGRVVFDGTVMIEYAPEYRDLFPSPARIRAVPIRGQGSCTWQIEGCG